MAVKLVSLTRSASIFVLVGDQKGKIYFDFRPWCFVHSHGTIGSTTRVGFDDVTYDAMMVVMAGLFCRVIFDTINQ